MAGPFKRGESNALSELTVPQASRRAGRCEPPGSLMAGPFKRGESNALSELTVPQASRRAGRCEPPGSLMAGPFKRGESKGRHANFSNSFCVVVGVPFVYILRCSDGSLYIGHTDDLQARVGSHNAGLAALFTRKRRPVTMVYSEHHPSRQAACRRERQLKRWTRRKKDALVSGDLARLKRL